MLVKSQVKYIQSLGQKKHRDEAKLFVAEGPKLVTELLREPGVQVRELYAVKEWMDSNKAGNEKGIEWIEVSEAELQKISQLSTPNQVLAVIDQFEEKLPQAVNDKWVIALDNIQDPGNMGTIIRIADWFGFNHIVCNETSADIYNSKVVQSTMGSIARVQVAYTDLAAWLSAQKSKRIYAAVLQGQDVTTMKKPEAGILVIGNESKGISADILELVNVKLTIPQKGKAESLNAAVATGILLSHIIS